MPASSLAWYSSGKVTFTSHASPAFLPISCSFEVADEGMGTDRQIVVGALAAFEGYAVDEAFIVDYSDVAILYRTLHNYSSGVVFLLLL